MPRQPSFYSPDREQNKEGAKTSSCCRLFLGTAHKKKKADIHSPVSRQIRLATGRYGGCRLALGNSFNHRMQFLGCPSPIGSQLGNRERMLRLAAFSKFRRDFKPRLLHSKILTLSTVISGVTVSVGNALRAVCPALCLLRGTHAHASRS